MSGRRRRGRGAARWLWRGLFALVLLIVGVAVGGVAWLRTSLPDAEATVPVRGLAHAVEVLRDSYGVPHIFAETETDAAFALGYVHAQDRLWQMESMRRYGAGRLAEVVGAPAVRSDRYVRTLGFYRLAEAQYASLSPSVRASLDAYAAGVNAWLANRDDALPPEFVVLRHAPEPWRPADSLVWARLMAPRLGGNARTELLRATLADRLSPARLAELWPDYPAHHPVTVEAMEGVEDLVKGLPLDQVLAALPLPRRELAGASNAWAIAGTHTATGRPVLANDPHLGLSAPINWYLVRIITPTLELVGATAPGVPFLILGHNGRAAWGFTATHADYQDVFVERVDSEGGRYQSPTGWRSFETRDETIAVRGDDPETLTVRTTRHGPVITDLVRAALRNDGDGSDETADTDWPWDDSKALALSATFLRDDDRTPEALYALNRAASWESFAAAARSFHAPQQNLLYADVQGTIGFLSAGRLPIRRGGGGGVPRPGWTGESDWDGFVPFEDLPMIRDPVSGKLFNANNRVVPETYRWYISDDWDEGFRALRIEQLLHAAEGPHTLDDSKAMQMDTVSPAARQLLPLMLQALPADVSDGVAVRLLAEWDGTMSRERPEPLLFIAWLRAFNRAVYADVLGPRLREFWGLRPTFIRHVLTGGAHWCDDTRTGETETCAQTLARSLDTAVGDLSESLGDDPTQWRWGDVHQARLRHRVFDRIPLLDRWTRLDIPIGGGPYTLNRAGSRIARDDDPFGSVHGAGFRAVYDLADLDRSRFMIATGQSGNPFSPHYGDLARSWRDGGWITLAQSRSELGATALSRIILVPQ